MKREQMTVWGWSQGVTALRPVAVGSLVVGWGALSLAAVGCSDPKAADCKALEPQLGAIEVKKLGPAAEHAEEAKQLRAQAEGFSKRRAAVDDSKLTDEGLKKLRDELATAFKGVQAKLNELAAAHDGFEGLSAKRGEAKKSLESAAQAYNEHCNHPSRQKVGDCKLVGESVNTDLPPAASEDAAIIKAYEGWLKAWGGVAPKDKDVKGKAEAVVKAAQAYVASIKSQQEAEEKAQGAESALSTETGKAEQAIKALTGQCKAH